MKVTIGIPTYNRSAYLSKAIESALNQTYKDTEVIVVDNFSSDNTENIVEKFRNRGVIYKTNNENIGMLQNWNKCIEIASGDLLMILGNIHIFLRIIS